MKLALVLPLFLEVNMSRTDSDVKLIGREYCLVLTLASRFLLVPKVPPIVSCTTHCQVTEDEHISVNWSTIPQNALEKEHKPLYTQLIYEQSRTVSWQLSNYIHHCKCLRWPHKYSTLSQCVGVFKEP